MSNKNKNNEQVRVNSVDENKEEKNMTAQYDDEMDLRDDVQKAAEEAEETTDLKEVDSSEVGFFEKHKKAILITGGVVLGVAVVGVGLWGVHNVGLGKTFFGGKKGYKGHKHHRHTGRYSYGQQAARVEMPNAGQAQVVTEAVQTVAAAPVNTDNVIQFAEAAKEVTEAAAEAVAK